MDLYSPTSYAPFFESYLPAIKDFFISVWAAFTAYIALPHVYWALVAWTITFTVLVTLALCLGFGPAGVLPGSLAAAFQSAMYGGFTPAGGLFATLTSLAMVGLLSPALAAVAAVIALLPAVLTFRLVED
ncbi:hypothetical protein F4778DRAFT_711734 [Xylariomycetidae sp. FL2044]|nr:hypothetical protein F4778DRAFT_711734 [Xylariomycetidae sp. FL2044]